MSAVVCCLLVSFAWYEFAVVPVQRQMAAAQQQVAAAKKQYDDAMKAQADKDKALAQQAAAVHATLIVNSDPPGATVTVGGISKQTPATYNDLIPGKVTVGVHADGYNDYQKEVTVQKDVPLDLGIITLEKKVGSVSFTSPQVGAQYTLTGPNNYSHDGTLPLAEKLDNLPVGDYQLTVSQDDWKLPPINFTLHDQEQLQKEIKFPYASLTVTSTPSGAVVREGHTVMGQTPLTLPQLRPGDLNLSVDLPPYTLQRITIHLPDATTITQAVKLVQDKDFIAACGMPMVWVPDGPFWAGKYQVRQKEFEEVANYNPSTFRRPMRPVETISWEAATAFCDKLNQYERKAGKLPAGYHYALPTESQWSIFSADADIDLAPMSRSATLSSTVDAGASEPNKYGIYDTLGNVWEWCSDAYDDKGDHTMRGGCWLSSPSNFPSADTRSAGAPKYADKFTGFRVVLLPD